MIDYMYSKSIAKWAFGAYIVWLMICGVAELI